MKFELNETEHKLLRDILNDVMRQEGTGGDEYEETLNALHEKIVLYWMKEAEAETGALNQHPVSYFGIDPVTGKLQRL